MPLPNSIDAPYNFVPLSPWVHTPDWGWQVSHDLPFRDGLCGHLDLTITAETPILVGRERKKGEEPCTEHPGQVYPFKLPEPDGRYALPGTALKGMIRNVVEIASFSRMAGVDDQRLGVRDLTGGVPAYQRAMTETVSGAFKPLAKAGWLTFDPVAGFWTIRPCQAARVDHSLLKSYLSKAWVKISNKDRPTAEAKYAAWTHANGLSVQFDAGPEQSHKHSKDKKGNDKYLIYRKATNLGSGALSGTLVFTGQPSPKKHMEFIFFGFTGTPIRVLDSVFRGFLDVHDQRTENGPQTPWEHWKTRPKVPVFYLEQPGRPGTVASLGLALMYKLAYRHSIHDAIRHSHPDHLDEAKDDFATLIFGRVGESPAACLKGRLAFHHAIAQGDPEPEAHGPTILNGPKATYYPNYIRQPRAQANRIPQGQGYATLMDPDCKIRGWKRYPARLEDQAKPQQVTPEQAENPAIQTTLHPLPGHTKFVTRVTFHNLKRVELGALCWALTWGGAAGLRHGLGMGKPFGFGQISIAIDAAALVANQPGSEQPRWEECVDAFIRHMDDAHSRSAPGGRRWRDAEQIRALLAMADPNRSPGAASRLRHMCLTTEDQNDFKDAKVARLVLADYPQSDHPPLWGEREAERQAAEERLQREAAEREEAQRREAEAARAKEAFDAKPAEEKRIIETQREVDRFLALDESQRRSQREALQTHLNRLAKEAAEWSSDADRNQAADLLDATYSDPKVGWTDPGINKKKREKQETKRRRIVADVRAGSTGAQPGSSDD